MFAYDLTNTLIAESVDAVLPPNQSELFAITVALLTYENRSLTDLAAGPVVLTNRNRRRIAELMEERTPSLAREFGDPIQLRRRLMQLVGLEIFQG